MPDWGVYCLIVFMFAIIAFKTCLEHYENKQELYERKKRVSFVNPEEILNSLYSYLNFTRDDVKLTLYKVLNKGKEEESKRIQKLGQIAHGHGKAIEIEMEDYYPIDHLDSAIHHSQTLTILKLIMLLIQIYLFLKKK